MDSPHVPTEILEQICRNLCFHCRNSDVFPNSDSDDARAGKVALARVSRLSKRYRAIAQPILYHYYATGNLVCEKTEYLPTDTWSRPAEDDKLPQFLRTIIQRPDLAACLRSMQLVDNRLSKETFPSDVVPLLISANNALGIDFPDERGFEGALEDSLNGYFPENEENRRRIGNTLIEGDMYEGLYGHKRPDKLHQWMAELAIVLAPKLESLLIARSYPVWDFIYGAWGLIEQLNLCESGKKLPCLRSLALTGHTDAFHLNEWKYLFERMPNLETLYAINWNGWRDGDIMINEDDFWRADESLSLPSLRKVVIESSCPQMEDLVRNVLVNSPRLEHVEYYRQISSDHTQSRAQNRTLAQVFGPLKDRLKTLTCVKWPPYCRSNDPRNPDPAFVAPGQGMPVSVWDTFPIAIDDTLRDFRCLTSLSVDCAAILGTLGMEPTLGSYLPESLEELHVTYIFFPFWRPLEHLIDQIPWRFPKLLRLRLGLPQRDKSDRERRDLESLSLRYSRVKNIEIIVEEEGDRFGPQPRTLIPGNSAGSVVVTYPSRKDSFKNGRECL